MSSCEVKFRQMALYEIQQNPQQQQQQPQQHQLQQNQPQQDQHSIQQTVSPQSIPSCT